MSTLVLSVKKDDAISLLTAVGYKDVHSMPLKRIERKLEAIVFVVQQIDNFDESKLTEENKQLLQKVIQAIDERREIRVVDDTQPDKQVDKQITEQSVVSSVSRVSNNQVREVSEMSNTDNTSAKVALETVNELETLSVTDAPVDNPVDTPVSESKTEETKKASRTKVGVVKAIWDMIVNTNENNRITMKEICDRLNKMFPDHNPESMKRTAQAHISFFFRHRPGKNRPRLDIRRIGHEYYCAGVKEDVGTKEEVNAASELE